MYVSHRQLPNAISPVQLPNSISPMQLPQYYARPALPPFQAPVSFRHSPTESPQSRPTSTVPHYPIPRLPPIPAPAVPAIIFTNNQIVLDRKTRRKAETHKTIPCRAWKDTGRCNYGSRCKFAHGDEDLRRTPQEPAKVYNDPRYRTVLCAKYHYLGSCPYGERCSYIHEQEPRIDLEKCLEQLSPLSSPEVEHNQRDKRKNSDSDYSTTSGTWSTSIDPFRDPFASDSQDEDIELKPIPFTESFLKRPFHVR